MNNKFKSTLVVSILVLAGFVMVWNFGAEDVNVQGADLFVGNDSTYRTIQAAIDNATSGDTIYVKNGTYPGTVLVNKSNIKLIGNSTEKCNITFSSHGTGIFDHAAAINVTSNGINISGFNISVTGQMTFGIDLRSSSTYDCNIFDNKIQTNGQWGWGISFYQSTTNNYAFDNVITTQGFYAHGIYSELANGNFAINNTISTSTQYSRGIYQYYSDDYTLIDNDIDTNTPDGVGIYLHEASNNDLINNTINTSGQSGYGINIVTNSDNNDLINNTINTSGLASYGINIASNSDYNNIINNTITTHLGGSYGIYMGNSDYNDINDTVIKTDNTNSKGITIFSSTGANIINNTITTLKITSEGITTLSSTDMRIINNTITTYWNDVYGIILDSSVNNDLINNTVKTSGNNADGIRLVTNSDDNELLDNKINTTNDDAEGISLSYSEHNDLFNNTITTEGDNADGIWVDTADFNDLINNTIMTSGATSYGVKFYSASYSNITINTINTSSLGIKLQQDSDHNNLTDNVINTTGMSGHGINIDNSYNNDLINNTITTWMNTAYGIYVYPNSQNNNLIENTIGTHGNNAYGIFLEDVSNNNLTINIINTSGINSHGIYLEISDNNNLTGNEINTTNSNALGIYVYDHSNYNDLISNEIQTYQQGGHGIFIWQNSNNNYLYNNTIDTYYMFNEGIHIEQSWNNTVSTNTINTYESTAFGIYLFDHAINTSLMGNTINTYGINGYGIYIDANSNLTTLTGNSIQTTNSSAHGIYIVNSNNTYIWDCNAAVSGSNAFGIYQDSMFTTAVDSSFSSTIEHDIYLMDDAILAVINCSFNDLDVINDGGGVLVVMNFLWLQVYYEDTVTPILNADVKIEDNGNSVYNSSGYGGVDPQTDANGQITTLMIIDRLYIYSNTTTENITTVHVKKKVDKLWEETRNVDMSTSHTEIFIATDIFKPAIPTGLNVTRVGNTNTLNITWDLNTDDTVNYTIWVIGPACMWQILANVTHPTNWTLDVDLPDDVAYNYKIVAWDDAGLSSGESLPVQFVLEDITPPAVPFNLAANPVPNGDAINITWDLNTDDTIMYELWWVDPATGNWTLLVNISHSNHQFIFANESLMNGTEYHFKLRAWDKVNNPSGFTIFVDVTHRDYIAPAAPTNLTATALSETGIMLDWDASTALDVVGYKVRINETGAGAGGPFRLQDVVNALSYEFTGLLENVTYYFVVEAVDEAHNPTASGVASNTTWAVPPSTPTLDAIPTYTNNANLYITGDADANVSVLIFVNSNEVATISANETGKFWSDITLEEGLNELKAQARDQANLTSAVSAPETIILDITDPVADAGDDIDIEVGATTAFNGSGSTDNWGIVVYTWSFVYEGSNVKLTGAKSTYQFDVAGEYEVTLMVTDVATNFGTDTLSVNVTSIEVPDTEDPVADAGPDQTVEEGTKVEFDGSGSTDNDGISNYTWTFTYDGEIIRLYGETPSFMFDTPGNYIVTLAVLDFAVPTNTDSDIFRVNVTEIPPEVDADGDGMDDDWENDHGLNSSDPTDATDDPDSDDLENLEEFEAGTHPQDWDSDDDELPDGWEVENELDPLDNGATNFDNGADGDPDGDGFTNLEEYTADTDPNEPMTYPPEDKKDEEEGLGDMLYYIILLIIIIVIIAILALAISRRKPTEEELLATEEEDEE